jgi:hypothetical protein
MQISTVGACGDKEENIVNQVFDNLLKENDKKPSFLLVYFSLDCDFRLLQQFFVEKFADVVITGVGTDYGAFDKDLLLEKESFVNEKVETVPAKSRFSVRKFAEKNRDSNTNGTPNSEKKKTVFVTAFYETYGCFGNAVCCFEEHNLRVSQKITEASKMAGYPGVMPTMMGFFGTSSVGHGIKKEIENVYGDTIPVFGSAINSERGNNKVFTHTGVYESKNVYVITLFYLSCDVSIQSFSTVKELGLKGEITYIKDLELLEIDHQPAADYLFKLIGEDTSSKSIEELNALADQYREEYVISSLEPSIYGNRAFRSSIIQSITENRGVKTHLNLNQGDYIYLMKTVEEELFKGFMAQSNIKDRSSIIGCLHIMCVSYTEGKYKKNFKENIVDKVRVYNKEYCYNVYSSGGEIGKDIDETFVLSNFTVATVYFINRK